ncbi:diguanylate cyclase domain-containing protein [Pseudomonadota bacterium]
MSVRLKLTILLIILFVTAIGNAVFTFLLESNGNDKVQWVVHTNNVIYTSERLLGTLKDAETGQRGYLITLNSSYLEPYYSGKQESVILLKKLKKLTSDNIEQQERLSTIEANMKLKNDELAQTIVLAEQNRIEEALQIVLMDKGKLYMDKIREDIKEFIHVEEILLEQRKAGIREVRGRVTTFLVVEIVFFSLFAIFTFSFINNRLFAPMNRLLSSTARMKEGEKVEIPDVVSNDEMGILLSNFYSMSEKVHNRTQTLRHKAFHDELTGLKNRATVFEEIDSAIEESSLTDSKIVVFFLDLNKFKQINDSFGHDAGDLILKETASRLRRSVRSDDGVFRVGGDEFIILLNNIKNVSEVDNIAENILGAFKLPIMMKAEAIKVLPSIGIAISPDAATNSEDVVRFSDIAMYEAKKDDTAQYKFFDKGMLKDAHRQELDS